MLTFRDFTHLPEMQPVMDAVIAGGPGLTLVAGPEIRTPDLVSPAGVLPSGRSAIFQMLVDETLDSHPGLKCLIITENRDSLRIARNFRRRVEYRLINAAYQYSNRMQDLPDANQAVVVVDRLGPENIQETLQAAIQGAWILAQVETVEWGGRVGLHLMDMGAADGSLSGINWILAIQRLPALCPNCKRRIDLAELPDQLRNHPGNYMVAPGCDSCHGTGRQADVAVFDAFQPVKSNIPLWEQSSRVAMDAYILEMVRAGRLPPEEYLERERIQFRRMHYLYQSSERALRASRAAYEAKLAEVEAGHRVLQQRTQSLVSLHEISQVLMSSTDLGDLGARLCRKTRELCQAERSILYYFPLGGSEEIEILAVGGWNESLLHRRLPRNVLQVDVGIREPVEYHRWPPGVPERNPDVEGVQLRTGLYVPLYAEERLVGVMIVNTSRRTGFLPGEVALLETFANQAAIAIQRAGLISELRGKIEALEAAQIQLAHKERMEHELALARQVQQSVLPRSFPRTPGYHLAARNEPARQVGGDFYDVIVLGDGRLGLAIADVSDKGMPAAFYMALARSLLRAEARRENSPQAVLERVNQLLLELGSPEMFVTVFYGILDLSSRRFRYSRAGHDRPLLFHAGQVHVLRGDGAALGILENDALHLNEEEITLFPGDRLVLYTDGLCDLEASDHQTLGVEGFTEILQNNIHLDARGIIRSVFRSLLGIQGGAEQFDDMTMMILEVEQQSA